MQHPATISLAAELLRKSIHLAAALAPLSMFTVGKWWAVMAFGILAAVATAYDVLRAQSPLFARWVRRIIGFMLRQEEWSQNHIVISGATWVLISISLVALLFPVHIAVPSLVMSLTCDAVSAIVGRRFGCHTWGRSRRTLEGSAAFLLTGLAIMALFPSIGLWAGAGCVLAAALSEIPSQPLNDNIRVPITAAIALAVLDGVLV